MPVTAGLVIGGVQAVAGIAQSVSGNRRLKRLAAQRETYKTPDEVYDAFNLSVNQAQSGLGANTKQYLTTQNDRAFSSSLDAVTKLGGDPNSVANIFDAQMNNIMKVSAADDEARLRKMDTVYKNLAMVAQGKDAEYASEQNLIKDKMAAEAAKVEAGQKNMQSGANMMLSAYANGETNKLYKEQLAFDKKKYDDFIKLRDAPAPYKAPSDFQYQQPPIYKDNMQDYYRNGGVVTG